MDPHGTQSKRTTAGIQAALSHAIRHDLSPVLREIFQSDPRPNHSPNREVIVDQVPEGGMLIPDDEDDEIVETDMDFDDDRDE